MANTDADGYPGLNKKHGFYRMMERNQRDRDDYNQRVEEMKDVSCLVQQLTFLFS